MLSIRDRINRVVVDAVAELDTKPRIGIRVGTTIPAKLRQSNLVSRWRKRRDLIGTLRRADVVIGVSEGVCDGVRELLGDDSPEIRCIYTYLDLDRLRCLAARESEHGWCGADGGRLLISVGRLVKAKDQGVMLKALARLPADYRLIIFGEGKQRPALEALARRLGVAERLVPLGDPDALARAILETLENPPSKTMLAEALQRLQIGRSTEQYLDALGLQIARPPGTAGR